MEVAKYMGFNLGVMRRLWVMRRLSAIYQWAISGLSELPHAAFASQSKFFSQRHCCGKLIGRRAPGMGANS
jgi:hypothetical protein